MTKYPWFPLSGWIYQQWCVRFEYGKHVRAYDYIVTALVFPYAFVAVYSTLARSKENVIDLSPVWLLSPGREEFPEPRLAQEEKAVHVHKEKKHV